MTQTIQLTAYDKGNNEYYFKLNNILYIFFGYDYTTDNGFFCYYDNIRDDYNNHNKVIINLSIDDVSYMIKYLDSLLEVFVVDSDFYPDIIKLKKLLKFKIKLKLL